MMTSVMSGLLAPWTVRATDLPASQTVSTTGSLSPGSTGSNLSNTGGGASVNLSGVPAASSGSIKSGAAAFGGCFAAGVLTPIAQALIDDGINYLNQQVDKIANKLLKSFFGGITGILGGNVPVSDSSVGSTIKAIYNQEDRSKIITRCLAWGIMTSITNNTLTIARTKGRDGGSTYVQNWVNFQTQSQYRGENIFRAELSTANLCGYLSNDIKKSYGVSPNQKTPLFGQNTRVDSLQPFSLQANCTMPNNFNLTNYQQDFAGNGGWDTWARMMQPQNNPYGLMLLSQNEIQKQRDLQQSADTNQALAGNGSLGVSGNGAADSCQIMGPNNQCLYYKNIKTPGSVIAQGVGATIGAQFQWLTTAQGLNTIIGDATEVMLNRLLNFGSSDEGSYHQASGGYIPTTTTLSIPGVTGGTASGSADGGAGGGGTSASNPSF